MIKLPKTGCKTFKVLQFIGSQQGARYTEIVRFICAINGKNYDAVEYPHVPQLNQLGFPCGRRRVHRGEWATNLNARRDGIFAKYCVKGSDKKWYLRADTAQALGAELLKYVGTKVIAVYYIGGYKMLRDNTTSALSSNLPSDEIVNNSKVVSREVYRTVENEPALSPLERAVQNRKDMKARIATLEQEASAAAHAVRVAKDVELRLAATIAELRAKLPGNAAAIVELIDGGAL